MLPKTVLRLVAAVALMLGVSWLARPILAQPNPATSHLSGTVKTPDGKALGGIGVSARNANETFTTTVYTDQSGRYSFPPLTSGQYKVRAQAVGFETALADVTLADGANKQVELTLANVSDFHKQLSGTEWAASLPEDTPDERRMKTIFINNCSGCHQVSFLLQNKFDVSGWSAIISLMERMLSIGYAPENATPNSVIHAYKEQLAAYLARVRGPDAPQLNYKLLPRPTGEAAQIVVTRHARRLDHETQRGGLDGRNSISLGWTRRARCGR
jgi:Carboxypeptidase regulatory-like domain